MSDNLTPYLQKLPEYLQKQGINLKINSSGKCPIKEHKSHQPFRLGIGKGGDPVWFCFACDEGGNIFDLAALLHGYPKGNEPGFYEITVRHLSDELGLPFPERNEKRNPAEQYKYDLYNATREISNKLSFRPVEKYAKERGWTAELLKEFKVGAIENYSQVLAYLQRKYSDKVLKDVGYLTKNPNYPSMFNDNRLIFTIHDHHGRPVGFTGRVMEFKLNNPRKYINTGTTPIFSKRKVLYNIHKAKVALQKEESKILYMVEGQADVLSLASVGIKSAVAISGTAFTKEHVELIKDFDLVISCLDADDGGSKATRTMYKKYSDILNKDLYLLTLPWGFDPDKYIKEKGLESFLNIKPVLPIEWEILNEYVLRGPLLADFWLPRIAEMNNLYSSTVLQTLSVKSGVSLKDLQTRLNILLLEKIKEIGKFVLTGNIKIGK